MGADISCSLSLEFDELKCSDENIAVCKELYNAM